MALFLALVDHAGPDPQEPLRSLIGQHAAELWTLRLMSLSVAAKLASGEDPMLEASIVKDLGNSLEQDLPRLVQASVDCDLDDASALRLILAQLLKVAPPFELRGGTREFSPGFTPGGWGRGFPTKHKRWQIGPGLTSGLMDR